MPPATSPPPARARRAIADRARRPRPDHVHGQLVSNASWARRSCAAPVSPSRPIAPSSHGRPRGSVLPRWCGGPTAGRAKRQPRQRPAALFGFRHLLGPRGPIRYLSGSEGQCHKPIETRRLRWSGRSAASEWLLARSVSAPNAALRHCIHRPRSACQICSYQAKQAG